MDETSDGKNESQPRFAVVRGQGLPGLRGRRIGRRPGVRVLSIAERELEREMRDAFVVMKGARGTTPSRGIAAICCADGATPWRAMGLRTLEAIADGASDEKVRALGVAFLAWIDRQLMERRRRPRGGVAA